MISPRIGDSEPGDYATIDLDDEHVLAQLRDLVDRHDPVPAGLTDRIGFAITVAALEAEVAELTVVSHELAGVRGEGEVASTVTFTGSDLTVMITVEIGVDGSRRVSGWASASPVEVELRFSTGSRDTVTDAQGRFHFDLPGADQVHLVLRRTDVVGARALITPPMEI